MGNSFSSCLHFICFRLALLFTRSIAYFKTGKRQPDACELNGATKATMSMETIPMATSLKDPLPVDFILKINTRCYSLFSSTNLDKNTQERVRSLVPEYMAVDSYSICPRAVLLFCLISRYWSLLEFSFFPSRKDRIL